MSRIHSISVGLFPFPRVFNCDESRLNSETGVGGNQRTSSPGDYENVC